MKKNDSIAKGKFFGIPEKIILRMKLTTLFLLMCFVQVFAVTSYSQSTKLTMELHDVSVVDVLKTIEEKSEFYFVYNKDAIDLDRKVSLNAKDRTINDVLDFLFKETDVSYKVIDRHIILSTLQVEQSSFMVKGRVTSSRGETIPGATVLLKGTNKGTITDSDGAYTISNIPGNGTLVFSFVGMKTVEVNVGTQTTIDIVMQDETIGIDEVVAVGYGTTKRELLSGSIASMKLIESDTHLPTTMTGNLLAGKLAGVSVSTPNGIPGQSSPGITIRTVNSFNSQPVLYVIDGKISGSGDFNNLNPNDIETISVLKDAASAAVYGSRAAGGVIVVTTKMGTTGKTQINYSLTTGFDSRIKNVPLTSAIEQGRLFDRILPGGFYGMEYSESDYEYFKTVNNGYGYDQLAAVYQDPTTTTHNISASGGTEKIKYFFGGSYVNQNGFLENLKYKKYNVRTNITADVTQNLQIYAGLSLNDNRVNSTTSTGIGDPSGIYTKLLVWQPWMPVFTNGGKPLSYGWIGNMGAEVMGLGGYINTNMLKPVINLSATYKAPFMKGLSAKASYFKSYTDNRTKIFQKQYMMYITKQQSSHIWSLDDADITGTQLSSQVNPSYLQENVNWSEDKQLNFQINYERTFADVHHFKGWLIFENYIASGAGVSAGIQGFPVYTTDQWWAASTRTKDNQYVSNSTNYSDYTTGRRSWVGQFFYDYKEKYIANLAYRYDGSMNFGPEKRWGLFPSGSLAWIISKEDFFHVDWINNLKVRVSIGLVGNDAVGGWQWQTSYKQGNNYYLGDSPSTNVGITYGAVVNPDLTWEKSLNKNFGVDINFLKHFNASAEYWYTHTYDILGSRIQTTPPTFSLSLPATNYGIMNAQGYELSIGYNNQFGKVKFNTNVTASYGFAKWVKRDVNATYDYQNYVGRSTSYVVGYQVEGILRTQADLDKLLTNNPNYKFNGYTPELGQLYYKDINSSAGLGIPDGVVDNYDITVLRKNNDPIVFGWNFGAEWKGITLNANFNGMAGYWKSFQDLAGGVEWNRLWNKWYSDSWTPDNTGAMLPIRYSAGGDSRYNLNQAPSKFWLKDASFIRLKSLELAYAIPAKLYQRLNINQIQIYVSGTNLFILSKFNKDYYDPEMSGGTAFPIMRSFNFGINVNL